MALPRAQRLEHVELRVSDHEVALEFYKDVLGLVELETREETTYLGCGYDKNFDLALTEGGTGVEHFAIRVSADEFDQSLRLLQKSNVETLNEVSEEPNQRRGVRFRLPGGVSMELVTVTDTTYINPADRAHPPSGGICPLDIDHINLLSTDVRADAQFLKQVLGFKFSDVSRIDSRAWTFAWTRFGGLHHDVGITMTEADDESLHHVAWTVSDFDHMKQGMDLLADAGYSVEFGPSRHPVGSNLFAYIWEPSGNRIELSAEMAVLDEDSEPTYWDGQGNTLDAWRDPEPPESFFRGS